MTSIIKLIGPIIFLKNRFQFEKSNDEVLRGLGEAFTKDRPNCVAMKVNPKVKMEFRNCEEKFRFLCQVIQDQCSQGYQKVGEKCYKMIQEQKVNFKDAKMSCANQGGKLAQIQNQKEAEIVRNTFGQVSFWVGIKRYTKNEKYVLYCIEKVNFENVMNSNEIDF